VSESTVKTHVLHIYEKFNVRTRLDLISLAIEQGVVGPRQHVRIIGGTAP
jgi:DNA-binding CsgD family transcriptional regulator